MCCIWYRWGIFHLCYTVTFQSVSLHWHDSLTISGVKWYFVPQITCVCICCKRPVLVAFNVEVCRIKVTNKFLGVHWGELLRLLLLPPFLITFNYSADSVTLCQLLYGSQVTEYITHLSHFAEWQCEWLILTENVNSIRACTELGCTLIVVCLP